MTQIKYTQLEDSLKSFKNESLPQLFIVWGERYLTDEKVDIVVSRILSKKERELSYTVLSDENLTVSNIIDEISTFSVFLDKKVVFAKNFSPGKEELNRLSDFLNNKLPENNFLILSLVKIDKRSKLFKTVKEMGLAVDCAIAKGINKRDIQEQTQFLRTEMNRILQKNHKEIEEKAFINLIDLTGFNPDTFVDNLNKLVSFIGEKNRIINEDVIQLVKRSKIDPIFDFTNAFSDKNLKKALFFLTSLLNSDFHPLQILKALTNHVRKIFAVKCFIESFNMPNKKIWGQGQDFNTFNNIVVPEIKRFDNDLVTELDSWQADSSDFFLASKSKSTYPEYQTFKKSDNFSLIELKKILIEIGELDNKFKSSSQDPQILLKDFMFRICI